MEIDIAGETFTTHGENLNVFGLKCFAGLVVLERNWLDVYPYTNWGGNSNLPNFVVGQTFMPTELSLKEVKEITYQENDALVENTTSWEIDGTRFDLRDGKIRYWDGCNGG